MNSLAAWLVLVAILYIAIMIVIALRTRKEASSLTGYFLAGRNLGAVALLLTFLGTRFSAFSLVGLPGFFYAHGIGTWIFIGFAEFALVFTCFLIGYRFRERSLAGATHSPVELLSQHYFGPSKHLGAVATIVTTIFLLPYLALQMVGVGRLLEGFEGLSVPFWGGSLLTLVLILVMLFYSDVAGMPAVVVTDKLQAIVMFTAVWVIGLVVVFGSDQWTGVGGLFRALNETGDSSLLALPGPKGYFERGNLVSLLILVLGVVLTQPQLIVRFFLGASDKVVRKSMVLLAIAVFLLFLPVMMIGLGGTLLAPDLESPDQVTSRVLERLAPNAPWFIALFVVGVVAAAMSTADSQLLALGGGFARDIFKNVFKTNASDREEKLVARVLVVIVALVAFLIAWRPPALIVQLSILSAAGTLQLAPAYLGMLYGKKISAWWPMGSIVAGLATLALLEFGYSGAIPGALHPAVPSVGIAAVVMIIGQFGRSARESSLAPRASA